MLLKSKFYIFYEDKRSGRKFPIFSVKSTTYNIINNDIILLVYMRCVVIRMHKINKWVYYTAYLFKMSQDVLK